MKKYELSVLIHPDLEANLEAVLEKVRAVVTDAGGTITKEENIGKNKLAYKIKGQDFAMYVYMDVELPADAPTKINSAFNITEEVIRYLLVATDEKGRQALEEAKADGRSGESQTEE